MKLGKMLSVGEVVEHPSAEETPSAEVPATPVSVPTAERSNLVPDRESAPEPVSARATR